MNEGDINDLFYYFDKLNFKNSLRSSVKFFYNVFYTPKTLIIHFRLFKTDN